MISVEFLLTSLVVVLVPGTGAIYTVSTALLRGRRASFFASLGCTLGILPHLAATILGLAAVLQSSAQAFQVLRFAGAFFLVYMAVVTWRDRTVFTIAADEAGAAKGDGAHVLHAIVLNLLNPKLTIFFVAFLPQFVDPAAGQPMVQLLVLSAAFMAMTLGVFVAYGLVAFGFRRHVMGSDRLRQGLRVGFSAVFVGLGGRLALSDH